jgi:hypothetical protein
MMLIRRCGRIYVSTPEASPNWECFIPAEDQEHGDNVVTFKGIGGRWMFEEEVTPHEVLSMVLSACYPQ